MPSFSPGDDAPIGFQGQAMFRSDREAHDLGKILPSGRTHSTLTVSIVTPRHDGAAGIVDRADGEERIEAGGPERTLDRGAVIEHVRGLHAGVAVLRGEARNVRGVDGLAVLDAQTRDLEAAVSGDGLRVVARLERESRRRIADRVHRRAPAPLHHELDPVHELAALGEFDQHPALAGSIGVVGEHRRGARPQRAVQKGLAADEPHAIIAVEGFKARERGVDGKIAVEHGDRDPDREVVANPVEHLEDVEILLEEAGLPTSGLDPDDSEAALEREAVETALARLRKNKETEERMLEQIGGSSLQRADALREWLARGAAALCSPRPTRCCAPLARPASCRTRA